MNMGVPEEVIFEEGKITNLYNIPEGIETLKVNKNILNTLDNLPSSLKCLQIEENYLQKVNIANLTELKELNLSHNKLEEIQDLPGSLMDISVSHNFLSRRAWWLNGWSGMPRTTTRRRSPSKWSGSQMPR